MRFNYWILELKPPFIHITFQLFGLDIGPGITPDIGPWDYPGYWALGLPRILAPEYRPQIPVPEIGPQRSVRENGPRYRPLLTAYKAGVIRNYQKYYASRTWRHRQARRASSERAGSTTSRVHTGR